MLEHFDQGQLERAGKPKGAAEGEYWWQLPDADLYVFFPSDDTGFLLAVDPNLEEDAFTQGAFIAKEEMRGLLDFLTVGLESLGE